MHNLKLNLNSSLLVNQEEINKTDSERIDRITEKAKEPTPKNSSSERKDRVDSKPIIEVETR